jgi:hypothetical protein
MLLELFCPLQVSYYTGAIELLAELALRTNCQYFERLKNQANAV